jgi:hypothetical protein
MTFVLLDSLSLPGDAARPNEDAFGHDGRAALVMDGATMLGDALMPGPSDAAWIARFGTRRVLAHLSDGAGARKALRAALGDTKKSFEALRRAPPEDMWQTPAASMMLVTSVAPSALRSFALGAPARAAAPGAATGTSPAGAPVAWGRDGLPCDPPGESRRGTELEFLWFGDCAALVGVDGKAVTVVGETFERRAAEARRAQALAKKKRISPAHGLSRQEFLSDLRATRNRMNSGNGWLFTPEPRAAAHAGRRVMKAAPGTHLLLASDGVVALVSDYGAYGPDSLMAAAQGKGLAALGEELRAIENADADGERFARFKKSDDCTALLLRLA